MLERRLRSYDPAKGPLYAYWYAALAKLCIDVARRAIRRRTAALSNDVVDRRPSLQAISAVLKTLAQQLVDHCRTGQSLSTFASS